MWEMITFLIGGFLGVCAGYMYGADRVMDEIEKSTGRCMCVRRCWYHIERRTFCYNKGKDDVAM